MQIRIKEEDLVLQVSSSYDPNLFDIGKYEAFIDKLCGTREYQKEAIKQACIFMLWGRYKNLGQLAQENYNINKTLQDKYSQFSDFEKRLELKNKLACSIDLATGTWKSYVIYGIAQIMLCEWKIDKVLVLCPSITIEDGLTSKFRDLASNRELKELLPPESVYKNPTIIQATQTLEPWSICIENIHSTYKNTSSAIADSVWWWWERILVLNDEAHHIYSKANSDVKKRFEFLSDEWFWFKYIVWFTGTPYVDNEYFTDVVYRYGILEWMEAKFIKKVDYIKDSDKRLDKVSRMQLVLHNHIEAKVKYTKIKPISIVVSKDIEHCEKDKKDLIDFLVKEEWGNREDIEKKVLIVTSDKAHKQNLEILKTVGDSQNPVEWICSVAMLTEWRDVPNVFQIVPSEERAFDSKLLISQVIGRWLRIPVEYKWEDLSVIVLNHTKFKDSITHLVDEILEKEDRIYSYPIEEKKSYAFPIYNLIYDEQQIEEAKTTEYKAPSFRDGFNLFSDDDEEDVSVTYWTMWSDKEYDKQFTMRKESKTIDDLTNEIYNKIQAWCIELEGSWADQEEVDKLDELDFDTIKYIIQKSLDKKWLDNQKISIDNCNKILQWFGVLKRFGSKNVRYNKEAKDIKELNIYDSEHGLKKSWIAIDTVKKGKAYIFYDENSTQYSLDEDKNALDVLGWEAWPNFFINVANTFYNKTPLNIGVAWSNPEKLFYDMLIAPDTAKHIDWFFKSKDKWFYDLEYRRLQGTRTPKVWKFNPDFFIKSGNNILVVEIKWTESEKEYSRSFLQNKAKYQQAKKHFDELNRKLEEKWIEQRYYFNFCSPKDYKTLFKYLSRWTIDKFTSRVESAFEESLLKDSLLKDNSVKQIEFFDDKELRMKFWQLRDSLEWDSKIYIATCEKNYFDNRDNETYNFSWWELIKAFELELRNKIFDRIRDDEDISLKIIEEESKKEDKYKNKKAIKYFNYASEQLDLWAMENLLTFNNYTISYIRDNFKELWFDVWQNSTNKAMIKDKKFNQITNNFYKDLPNLIWLIREKFRNADSHWARVMKKEELEELRDIMIFWEWVLIKIQVK